MGDEVGFYSREPQAEPRVVDELRRLKSPPADPELLARLIDEGVGVDLQFKAIGLDNELHKIRKPVWIALRKARQQARDIIALRDEGRDLDSLLLSIAEVLNPALPNEARERQAHLILQALELLSASAVADNLSTFKKPKADDLTGRAVLAVARYYHQLGLPFTGSPRRTQADRKAQYIVKGPAARLTADVLDILGLSVTGPQLATHMNNARNLIRQKPPL